MPPVKQAQGYARTPQAGGMPARTEAWALVEAARRMAESPNAEKPRKAMQEALRLNWRLWTIFQAELTVLSDESVPPEIRINMLTLAKFVDKHTVGCLPDPSLEKLQVLININRELASGLLAGLEVEHKATEALAQSQTPVEAKPINQSL
jgi:flagellar protein FlaF